jgi:hypothetical protein
VIGGEDVDITVISTLIIEIGVLLGAIIPVIVFIVKLTNGMKCQLRSEMLRIYYHNKDAKKIRQYEYENFVYLYESYKALKGNSFIDKIYKEVQTWEVVS